MVTIDHVNIYLRPKRGNSSSGAFHTITKCLLPQGTPSLNVLRAWRIILEVKPDTQTI